MYKYLQLDYLFTRLPLTWAPAHVQVKDGRLFIWANCSGRLFIYTKDGILFIWPNDYLL